MHPSRFVLGVLMMFLALLMMGMQWQGNEVWLWLRPGISTGEWWRSYTGHFVHLGWIHLAMNVVAMWLLAVVFAGVLRVSDWIIALLVLPLLISEGLWWSLPGLKAYAGLSGVLHGVFALGAFRMLGLASERSTGLAYVLLLLLKLVLERVTGETTVTAGLIGGPVLIEAHQFGAAAGVFLAVLQWGGSRLRGQSGRAAATKQVP